MEEADFNSLFAVTWYYHVKDLDGGQEVRDRDEGRAVLHWCGPHFQEKMLRETYEMSSTRSWFSPAVLSVDITDYLVLLKKWNPAQNSFARGWVHDLRCGPECLSFGFCQGIWFYEFKDSLNLSTVCLSDLTLVVWITRLILSEVLCSFLCLLAFVRTRIMNGSTSCPSVQAVDAAHTTHSHVRGAPVFEHSTDEQMNLTNQEFMVGTQKI